MYSRININAIFSGCTLYCGLYLFLFIATSFTGDLLQGYWGQFIVSPYMTLMYVFSGYLAGIKSQTHGLLHGGLVGAAIALGTAAIDYPLIGEVWYGESIIGGTLNYLITCTIMCGLGGGVGELHARKKFTA